MEYAFLIGPRLHRGFADNYLFEKIVCIFQRTQFGLQL